MSYATPRTGDLTPWLDAVRSDQPAAIARQHLDYFEVPATAPLKATTDQQGRFRFERFGAERVAHLLLEGPTIASAFFTVVTRPIESFRGARFSVKPRGPGQRRSTGRTSLTPPRPAEPVEGIVRDAQTRKPLRACHRPEQPATAHRHRGESLTSRRPADDQGRFRLVGLAKRASSPRTRGWRSKLPDRPPERRPAVLHAERPGPRPSWNRSRSQWRSSCTAGSGSRARSPTRRPDSRSGTFRSALPPVPGEQVRPGHAGIRPEPERAGHCPETATRRTPTAPTAWSACRAARSSASLPGIVVPYRFGYGVRGDQGDGRARSLRDVVEPHFRPERTWLLSMKEINPAEGTEAVHVDLELDPGASVRVRVVDREGKPVPGSSVTRRMSTEQSRDDAPGRFRCRGAWARRRANHARAA